MPASVRAARSGRSQGWGGASFFLSANEGFHFLEAIRDQLYSDELDL
jgi:hypothetical protein